MDSKEVFDGVFERVSPLVRDVILDWLVTPFTFQEMLDGLNASVVDEVIRELTSLNVVVWTAGVPELDFHEVM